MSKKAKYSIIVVAVAVLAGVAVLSAMKGNNTGTEVRIEPVQKRDLVASVTASGQVRPHTKVDVAADISGRIVRLAVKEGQMVSKGQFLLQIDAQQAEANVQRNDAVPDPVKAQVIAGDQPVPKQSMAGGRQDRLGMELDALDGPAAVAQPHDDAVAGARPTGMLTRPKLTEPFQVVRMSSEV